MRLSVSARLRRIIVKGTILIVDRAIAGLNSVVTVFAAITGISFLLCSTVLQ